MEHRIADLLVALATTLATTASFAQAPPASAPTGAPGATGAAAATRADAARTPTATTPAYNASATTTGAPTNAAGAAAATADVQRPSNSVLGAGPGSNVRIGRVLLGSGEPGGGPGAGAYENATQVYENLFHAPQYMPYFPTAATIWPRVIEVPCRQSGADLVCDRYYWRPEYGRGEYLFFTPVGQSTAASTTPGTAPAAPQSR